MSLLYHVAMYLLLVLFTFVWCYVILLYILLKITHYHTYNTLFFYILRVWRWCVFVCVDVKVEATPNESHSYLWISSEYDITHSTETWEEEKCSFTQWCYFYPPLFYFTAIAVDDCLWDVLMLKKFTKSFLKEICLRIKIVVWHSLAYICRKKNRRHLLQVCEYPVI